MEIDISTWPEKPYQWMVNDLRNGLDKANANYLVALGLFCYTEVMGREVLRFRHPDNKDRFRNQKCFELFLGEYMGYRDLLDKHDNLYDMFRNGVIHEYHIKGWHTGVYQGFSADAGTEVKRMGYDPSKGLLVLTKSEGLKDNVPVRSFFIARPYLEHFTYGIHKFLEESGRLIEL